MLIKISLLLFLIILFVLFLKKQKQFVLYSLLFASHISILISLILIEEGLFIYEQQIFGYDNNSFDIFYLFSILSLFIFYAICKKDKHEKKLIVRDNTSFFYIVSILFALVLIYCFIKNPDYNRFDIYYGPFQMTFVRIEYLFYFIYIFTLIRINNNRKKIYVFFIYCFLMFIRGAQFGDFYIAILWLFISIILSDNKLNFKILIFLFFLLLTSLLIKITTTDLSFFYSRIVMQGHVFWGTVNLIKDQGINPDLSPFIRDFNDITSSFSMGNINYGFGKLMNEISPAFASNMLEAGVRMTSGYPAILFYHFGYVAGFILHIGFLSIYYYVMKTLVEFIRTKKIYFTYFVFLIYMTYSDLMIQGEYANFRVKFLIKLYLFFMVLFIHKIFKYGVRRYKQYGMAIA